MHTSRVSTGSATVIGVDVLSAIEAEDLLSGIVATAVDRVWMGRRRNCAPSCGTWRLEIE
ncbi:hypothetical protein [Nocardia africana]|uniref:Uncharacterized protein n=1 Tax=Nocardia africana TaxID=134964 RepID=A0ABW6NCM6_9NOCA